jgi:MFS family permease
MVLLPEIATGQQFALLSGLVGLTVGCAGVLGPLLGGAIADYSHWKWIFLLNLPIGFVAMASIHFIWPPTPGIARGLATRRKIVRVDWGGMVMVLASSTLLVYGTTTATSSTSTTDPWTTTPVLPCLLLVPVLFVLFLAWETLLLRPSMEQKIVPLFPLRILKRRPLAFALATVFMTGFPAVTVPIMLPERFQLIYGVGPMRAGVWLLPLCAAVGVGAALGGIINRKMNRTFYCVTVGACLQTIGLGLLTTTFFATAEMQAGGVPAALFAYEAVLGLGVGLSMAAATILVSVHSGPDELAAAQGATAQLRMLGGVIGYTIAMSLLSSKAMTGLKGWVADAVIMELKRNPLGGLRLPPPLRSVVGRVFEKGFREGVVMLSVAAGLGILAALGTWDKDAKGMVMAGKVIGETERKSTDEKV